jgi:hypothetical protein
LSGLWMHLDTPFASGPMGGGLSCWDQLHPF